jgi:hypothetical protein
VYSITSCTLRLMYASQVVDVQPGQFYFAMKTYRRSASKLSTGVSPEMMIKLSPCVQRQFAAWIAAAMLNPPTTPPMANATATYAMYSDASMSGWGAVLVNLTTREVRSVGESWDPTMKGFSINVLECEATVRGVYAFREQMRGTHIDVMIDNTSVEAAVRRGYARAGRLNAVVSKLNESLRAERIHIRYARYIASKSNPADAPSRGQPISDADVLKINDLLSANPFNRLTCAGVCRITRSGGRA